MIDNTRRDFLKKRVFRAWLPLLFLKLFRLSSMMKLHSNTMKRSRQIVRNLACQFNALFINLQQPFIDACRHELISRQWLAEVRKSLQFLNIECG